MDNLRLQEVFEHGQNMGRGNLLGIQPFMERADYVSEAAFYARLDAYFRCAAEKGWINERTIAVLPEYLGTWLVAAGESASVLSAATITAAMRSLVLRHPVAFLKEYWAAKEKDRLTPSLFRLKAGSMARIYQSVFARLAKEYAVTIAAGSILLPDPRVVDGRVAPGKGRLYNAAFVFRPDGRAEPGISRKAYPIADELPFVACAPVDSLPVFDTPAGKLGVLVCADSWFPEAYRQLKTQGVELLAVPSVSSHGYQWYQPWSGYSGWSAPADVDTRDLNVLTEQQAWRKYALAGRIAISGARAGVNVFLYSDLWDLEFNGGRWRMVRGDANIEASRDGAALVNLWL